MTQGETYLEAGDICLTKTLTYAPVCFSYIREAYLEFGDKCIFLFAYFYSWLSSAFYFGQRINVEKIRNAYGYLVDNLYDQDLSFLNRLIAVF